MFLLKDIIYSKSSQTFSDQVPLKQFDR